MSLQGRIASDSCIESRICKQKTWTSKQSAENMVSFFLLLIINERKEIKKELKQKSEFVDLRNSQPFQIANNARIRRFTLRKACSGEKSKNTVEHPSAKEIRCVTHGSTQSSQGSQELSKEN